MRKTVTFTTMIPFTDDDNFCKFCDTVKRLTFGQVDAKRLKKFD